MSAPASARAIALDLLQAVLENKIPLDQALADNKAMATLAGRDRAFARLLVAVVLRRLGQLDALIAHCVERPLPRGATLARDALRLGAAQLLFLGTPPHAAVACAVELVAERGHAAMKGLVNAVLRRLSREGPALVAAQDAARLNTPDWLWQSWRTAYGEETARAIAAAHLVEAPLDLSVKSDAAGWALKLAAEILPTGTLRRESGGSIEALPGYEDGAWWVQDAAASLPAKLLGDVAGKTVADLCAAPGGKTAQLVAAGAKVMALDRAAPRLARLKSNLARLKLDAQCILADAESWKPSSPLPFILLDAPCSATGAIRRNPDVPHLKTPLDVQRMAALEDRLLNAAAAMLGPGGVLVYSTCSLEAEEGPRRSEALLARHPELIRRPIAAAEIGGLGEALTPLGELRTLPSLWPERGGMDGFYAARFARRA